MHFPGAHASQAEVPDEVDRLGVWDELSIEVVRDLGSALQLRAGTWRAMEEARAQGLVRDLGVANFLVEHLVEMQAYATVPPVANQVEVHPFLPRTRLVEYCRGEGRFARRR